MLVQEECVEVHASKRRGWSISAIARHLGRDRKTVRAYLLGERIPGDRARIGSDPFEPFEAYVRQRLSDDPHVWASALFDEIAAYLPEGKAPAHKAGDPSTEGRRTPCYPVSLDWRALPLVV